MEIHFATAPLGWTQNSADWTNWAKYQYSVWYLGARRRTTSQYASPRSKSKFFDFSQALLLLLSQKKVLITFFWKGKTVRFCDVFHARGKRALRTCFDVREAKFVRSARHLFRNSFANFFIRQEKLLVFSHLHYIFILPCAVYAVFLCFPDKS